MVANAAVHFTPVVNTNIANKRVLFIIYIFAIAVAIGTMPSHFHFVSEVSSAHFSVLIPTQRGAIGMEQSPNLPKREPAENIQRPVCYHLAVPMLSSSLLTS